jgi:hypothetical protein
MNERAEEKLIREYIHEIRNLKSFTKAQLETLNLLKYDDRMRILEAYNEMMAYIANVVEVEIK